jgi:hypothetical protein
MNFIGRKGAGITLGAAVRHEMDGIAARPELMPKRFGRKDMTAGPPGGKKDDAFGHSSYSAGTL